jgi:hypothetical protein
MVRKPRSVRHLLQDKPELIRLEREIKAQNRLLSHVRQCLPADLATHCIHAQFRDDTLVVHTDSPVWATRLRYLAPQLSGALAAEYPALRTTKVRLILDTNRPERSPAKAIHSSEAAQIIHSSATHTKSKSLQDALHRLSRAVKPR